MRPAAALAGVVIVLVTAWSLLRTLVVPRGSSWLNTAKNRALLAVFRLFAHRTRKYLWRDRILIWAAPLAIFSSLIMWLALFFVGYALLEFGASSLSMGEAWRDAGSALFTLGASTYFREHLSVLAFLNAVTGPVTIALLIGYLPTFYGAYQRREAEVTMMQARAGAPNWGPELLARHAQVGTVARLDELWPRWEQWAAELSESHTNFPILIHMRSTRPERNWLIALLCAMDAAAMQMSLNPNEDETAERLMLRQGIICLRELAQVEGIAFDEDPMPEQPSEVSLEDFRAVCVDLASLSYPMDRSVDEAYLHFRGWRANYEGIVYELASRIDAVPAPWSGTRVRGLPVMYPGRPVNRTPKTND